MEKNGIRGPKLLFTASRLESKTYEPKSLVGTGTAHIHIWESRPKPIEDALLGGDYWDRENAARKELQNMKAGDYIALRYLGDEIIPRIHVEGIRQTKGIFGSSMGLYPLLPRMKAVRCRKFGMTFLNSTKKRKRKYSRREM